MQRTIIAGTIFIAVALVGELSGQHRTFPVPPPPAVAPAPPGADAKTYRRLDTLTMEREARELSALAASIPLDVEQVKKGLLPKDVTDKLKRIEKLSKQLRAQLQP